MHDTRKKKLSESEKRTYLSGTTLVMDKTGPHSPPAFFGSRYDQNVMDIGSGVLVIRHYKRKNETKNDISDVLLEFAFRLYVSIVFIFFTTWPIK